MVKTYGSVDMFLDYVSSIKETLTDPNKVALPSHPHLQGLTALDIIMGRGRPEKVLSSREERDNMLLMGSLYRDKEFLRCQGVRGRLARPQVCVHQPGGCRDGGGDRGGRGGLPLHHREVRWSPVCLL